MTPEPVGIVHRWYTTTDDHHLRREHPLDAGWLDLWLDQNLPGWRNRQIHALGLTEGPLVVIDRYRSAATGEHEYEIETIDEPFPLDLILCPCRVHPPRPGGATPRRAAQAGAPGVRAAAALHVRG